MALIRDSIGKYSQGAQRKMCVVGKATAADIGTNSLQIGEIPAGAIVTDAHIVITEAFDGTTPALTTEVVDVDGTSLYGLQSAVAATATGRTSGAVTADPATVVGIVAISNSAADSTAGEVQVIVEYFVPGGRADENAG